MSPAVNFFSHLAPAGVVNLSSASPGLGEIETYVIKLYSDVNHLMNVYFGPRMVPHLGGITPRDWSF